MKSPVRYLDHASMGHPTVRTLDRVEAAVSALGRATSTGTAETLRQFEAVEKARRRIAKFIHTDVASILLVGNTSQALGAIASALAATMCSSLTSNLWARRLFGAEFASESALSWFPL
jgi:selenocysteine lyase/cysteine desulfurase